MGTISVDLLYPGYCEYTAHGTAVTMNAEGEKIAYIFQVPLTGTLNKIGILTSAITTGGDVTVRIETVSAVNGDPTGELYDANGTGTLTIGAGDDSVTKYASINSTTGITVTKGNIIAAVFTVPNLFVGNMNLFGTAYNNGLKGGFPYTDVYPLPEAAWAKSATMGEPLIILEYGTTMIVPGGCHAPTYFGSETWMSSSNPDHRGCAFQIPVKCRCKGVYISIDLDITSNVILYDSDGSTALETITIDPIIRGANAVRTHYVQWSTPRTFEKDTTYRIVLLPSTTTNISTGYWVCTADGSTNPISAFPGPNQFYKTTCNGVPTGLGSWTDDTTRRVMMSLALDQIIESGGLLRNPGMDGGMSG